MNHKIQNNQRKYFKLKGASDMQTTCVLKTNRECKDSRKKAELKLKIII